MSTPDKNEPVRLYDWIVSEFSVEARARAVATLSPHLSDLLKPGVRVLDLCCGTGPLAFYCEQRGAEVTAIDIADCMIQRAVEYAKKVRSQVIFVKADVLTYGYAGGQFDLALLIGNSVSDFSLEDFRRLASKVRSALRPGGRFVVHYCDGFHQFVHGEYQRERIQMEEPRRISLKFKEYLAEMSAVVETYTDESTGETCDYTSYIYTPQLIELAMLGRFDRARRIKLEDQRYLDFFARV